MFAWLRAWTVPILFLAFVAAELAAAFIPALRMRTLTRAVVTYLPWSITAAVVAWLVAWLPGHFTDNYRRTTMPRLFTAQYAKFWVALAAAVLTAAQTALPLTTTEHSWVAVVLAVLGAAGVVRVPNAPAPDPNTPRVLPSPPKGMS